MGYRYYWTYYKSKSPKEVKNGIKAKSRRGAIGETWWSQRWIEVLESFHMGARLGRGRRYAREGQVVSIDIEKGQVRAKVQGTRSSPYKVVIILPVLTDEEWEAVADAMASHAIFSAKLLAGEMPHDIEEAFESASASLFPRSKEELDTDCSCPDWANPCKHIAAVYFLLAERFDEDPFFIFKLRGRTKSEIVDMLRSRRTAVSAPGEEDTTVGDKVLYDPLDGYVDNFWEAGKELDGFGVHPVRSDGVSMAKRLGETPYKVGKKNIAELLDDIYKITSGEALKMAYREYSE